jgi:hypothetical protein
MLEVQIVNKIIDETDGSVRIDTLVVPATTPKVSTEANADGTKEYFVVVSEHEHLDSLYFDLETEGQTPEGLDLTRSVECVERRPNSRGTLYNLTAEEAESLKEDERVLDVHLHPKYLGIKPESHVMQYNGYFDKSRAVANNMVNWGLLRCTTGQQITNWGGTGYNGTGANTLPNQAATIELSQTGKNVDLINVDDAEIIWEHPEFYTNADGTGTNRMNYFNWWQYNTAVTGEVAGTYPTQYGIQTSPYYSYHPTHVTGIMAGNTHGWAKSANLYHIWYGTKDESNASYVFNYVREFHKNKAINPTTGIKNPTICNNSWGFSLPTSVWSWEKVSDLTYRGTTYTAPIYSGFKSGLVCWSGFPPGGPTLLELVTWNDLENYQHDITQNGASTSVAGNPDTSALLGPASLTASTTPTVGTNDDGYWTLSLPFPIKLGENTVAGDAYDTFGATTFNTIYVGTNSYITFEEASTANTGFAVGTGSAKGSDIGTPRGAKMFWCSGDHSIQRIYYGTEGTSPNRSFRVRIEGDANKTGTLGSPGMLSEWTFYENAYSNRTNKVIRVVFGQNNSVSRSGTKIPYSTVMAAGFVPNSSIPARIAAVDADVEDLIKNGVIYVGSAGNSKWKIDVRGGLDYNNSFQMQTWYPGQTWYLHQGQSPTNNDSRAAGGTYDLPVICVGATDSVETDKKVDYSNTGPGVDIWAPGTYVASSIANTFTLSFGTSYNYDSRGSGQFYMGKISGTSMSSPQVCGVLACALETYPLMTQQEAKNYIISYAKPNQIANTGGSYTDYSSLQGAPNLHLYYSKERNSIGTVFPKVNMKGRPATGQAYPRTRIRRT